MLLDIDGTLLDFAPTPDSVVVPPDLPDTLARLGRQLDGALAVVSGAAFGGGPAAPSLARQQAELESSLDAHRRRLVARRAMHTAAEDALHHAIDQLTSAV